MISALQVHAAWPTLGVDYWDEVGQFGDDIYCTYYVSQREWDAILLFKGSGDFYSKYRQGSASEGSQPWDWSYYDGHFIEYIDIKAWTVSIKFEGSIVSVPDAAFKNWLKVNEVELTESVQCIGYRSFMDCDALKEVTFYGNTIGQDAFKGCDALETFTIDPKHGQVNIGQQSFSWFGPKKLIIKSTDPNSVSLHPEAFYEARHDITLCVPRAALEAYNNHPQWRNWWRIESIEDGETLDEYLNLKSLTVNGAVISPEYNPVWNLSYFIVVSSSLSSVTINTTYDGNVTIEGLGTKQLAFGSNVFNIVVSFGSGKRVHKINIYRPSNDATLKTFSTSSGILSPAFDPSITEYQCIVPNSTTSITIIAEPNHSLAVVNGHFVRNINVGDTFLPFTVTSEEDTEKVYNLTVHRLSNDATLKTFSTSSGILSPAFDPSITDYRCTVLGSTSSITINAQTNYALAKVTDTDIGTKSLNFGDNIFQVTVTAEDNTIKTYTFNVYRPFLLVTSIKINSPLGGLVVGNIWTVNYTVFPSDAIDKTVEITCNSQGVEQLNASTFKFNESGYKTITVQSVSNPDIKDSCKIYVRVPVTSIKINNPVNTIEKGGLWFLDYTILPSDAFSLSVKCNYDSGVLMVWEYPAESPMFVFNESGYKTVTVQSISNPDIKDSCRVYVREPATSIKINNPPSGGIAPGDIWTVDYTVFPNNATDKTVKIICNSQGVEQLNDGTFIFHSSGYKTVTVQSVSNPDIKDSCRIYVREPAIPVTSIQINNPPSGGLITGDIWTVNHTVFPSDAIDKTVEITCNSQGVEQLNDNTFKFNESGYKDITITSVSNPDIKDSCKVYVREPATSIQINNPPEGLVVGNIWTVNYTVFPFDAIDKTVEITCNSQGVEQLNDSTFIFHSSGYKDITITLVSNPDIKDSCRVHVRVPVTSVKINKSPSRGLVVGDIWTVGYTVLPDTATDKTVEIICNSQGVEQLNDNTFKFNESGYKEITIISVSDPDVKETWRFRVKSDDASLKEKYVNITEGGKVIKIPLNPNTFECSVIVPSRCEYEIVMIPNDSAAVVGDVINVSPTVFTRTVTAEAGNSAVHYFTINRPPVPVERIIINNAPLYINGNTWIVDYTVLPDDASDKRVKISVILGDGVYVDGNRLTFNTSGLKGIEIVSVANPNVVVKHNFYVDLNQTGIDSVSEKNQTFRVFTVTGREIPKPEPGKVSILKYDSGRVEKVFVSSENK